MTKLPDIATLNPNQLISTADVAAYSGISKATIETWRCRSPGKLPKAFPVAGHLIRYRVADVRAWLGLTAESAA